MEIQAFLKKIKTEGGQFFAGVVSLDIINSSNLKGEPLEISQTKENFKKLILALIEKDDLPIAMLSWSGDGGLLISDGARGFGDVIVICDKIVSLLGFFNHSFGRLNFLRDERIHLRVVCDSGFIQVAGSDGSTLTANVVNQTAKRERQIGVQDHVVVTQKIFEGLPEDIKKRLQLNKEPDKDFGIYYILDELESNSIVRRNEGTSEGIRDWIAAAARLKKYDEIMIFTYTNETLYEYLGAPLANMKIRVLARNWLTESLDEDFYNESLNQPENGLLRQWKNAHIIKDVAQTLINEIHKQPFDIKVNLRFYDSHPFFKGIILRNSSTKRRIGYVGHYAWDPRREDSGSPFIGENWSAIWLNEDGGSQSNMLDALTSRFEEMWDYGKTFDQLLAIEKEQELNASYRKSAEAVWEIDGKKFLIIVPGREELGRLYPLVGAEDLLSMRNVERFLREHNANFDLKIMTKGDSTTISKEWDGHIVYICHRSISPDFFKQLKEKGFPYDIISKKGDKPFITHIPYENDYSSPMDEPEPKEKDLCLVAKARRPDDKGSIFIIAGLHGMGTLGGSQYLTDQKQLKVLFDSRQNSDFHTVLECNFKEHWEITNIENITAPQGLEKQ